MWALANASVGNATRLKQRHEAFAVYDSAAPARVPAPREALGIGVIGRINSGGIQRFIDVHWWMDQHFKGSRYS